MKTNRVIAVVSSVLCIWLALLATACIAAETVEPRRPILDKLLKATEANDYDSFVADGDPGFKAGITKENVAGVSAQLSPRMKQGYQCSYLGELNQRGNQVVLWKLVFKDGGDDILAILALKDGKVAGFLLRKNQFAAALEDITSRTSPFRDTAKYLSPFTMVHFDANDSNKVVVAYNGAQYQLAAIDGLSVADILDFCRRQYGQRPFGEGWAEKRFAEDLVIVLSDMKHPISSDNAVSLTLIDPQTGQQKIIAHASMTRENRAAIFQGRTLDNSNLLQY